MYNCVIFMIIDNTINNGSSYKEADANDIAYCGIVIGILIEIAVVLIIVTVVLISCLIIFCYKKRKISSEFEYVRYIIYK